jgi:hypothetical protein
LPKVFLGIVDRVFGLVRLAERETASTINRPVNLGAKRLNVNSGKIQQKVSEISDRRSLQSIMPAKHACSWYPLVEHSRL